MDVVTLSVPELDDADKVAEAERALGPLGVKVCRAHPKEGWLTVGFSPQRTSVVAIVRVLDGCGYRVFGLLPAAGRRDGDRSVPAQEVGR